MNYNTLMPKYSKRHVLFIRREEMKKRLHLALNSSLDWVNRASYEQQYMADYAV